MYWLADQEAALETTFIKRFDPRFWTVNFPRPMLAAVTTQGADALKVDLYFYRYDDLAGLIWESEDTRDHPLLAYETARDYRGVKLQFRWRSSGLKDLAALYGPTLTIEGRDAGGQPRSWYVRLWNYAQGASEDAVVSLDFDNMDGGFLLPGEADPVYAGDIDRLFISMTPPGYDGSAAGPLPSPVSASVTLSDIKATGGGGVLGLGDAYLPPHGLAMANGYDDVFNITPERMLRNALQLGYRGLWNHYVGMSHYFRLAWRSGEGRYIAARGGGGEVLSPPVAAWHQDFLARAQAYGFQVILALSFEMFDDYAPEDWKQRSEDGGPALTGWAPPSTLLSPCHADAMAYVRDGFLALAALAAAAGMPVFCQIGEPWWWSQLDGGDAPCFYDAATMALYAAETGKAVPAKHHSIFETFDAAQQAYLDWLGLKLGAATLALRDAVKTAYPGARVSLLFYTPQVLNDAAPMLARANLPAAWAYPAFDVFQIEDYDHVIAGRWAAHRAAIDLVAQQLGYGPADSHYFSGFILAPNDAPLWRRIDRAAGEARAHGYAAVFVWAYPQIMRDGFAFFELEEEDAMSGFHDIRFPTDISFGSSGGPGFSTAVIEMASGAEQRNANWADARARYDIGGGVRGEDDLAEVVAFFRARRGRAHGFRFKDWADFKSCKPTQAVSPLDQQIGLGDGVQSEFQLVKYYGDAAGGHSRRISKPVAGTLRIAVDGLEMASGWSVDAATGRVSFLSPPDAGAVIAAGFEFDVPVRFDADRLEVSWETFRAGEIPAIGLVEIRV